ncbi:hypothetical protein FIBSPDRAFT_1036050 [Athelia psychrophila]|uniref:DUF6532 domain-containing protein n=1 Tax=Athelia psychrophila TaxID=1759441 RepID=A0A166W8U6_9AGAM|nr:hypothetical protein FIBSPDRAFT_1036050 [Fibularhizoctonia sp. CBS 109695]
MSDSENYPPAAVCTPKRHRNEVDVSNVLPANAKKRRKSSSKKQADGVLFGNKKSSIGIAYADYFNPLPLQTIALIVAAIGFCLRLYLNNGIVGDEQFSETAVKPFYDGYLSELKEWSAIEPVVTEKVRRKQFKRALRSAGASVHKVTGMSQEAKLRARMNLVGREVDTGSEDEDDRGMQSEEI